MDASKILNALDDAFGEDVEVVFWNDPDAEFGSIIDELELRGVELIKLDAEPALALKRRIYSDHDKRYLIYGTGEVPAQDVDWMLDVRLWARSFSADRASMLLSELGLVQRSLRDHLARRGKFLAAKERVARLARLVQPDDDANQLDLKMLSVLARSDQPNLFGMLTAVLSSLDPADPEAGSPVWHDIERFELVDAFWGLVRPRFGYGAPDASISGLLLRLIVSELRHVLGDALPEQLAHLAADRAGCADAAVCLAHWRDSSTYGQRFESLAVAVSDQLRLRELLADVSSKALAGCEISPAVDQVLLRQMRDTLLEDPQARSLEPVASLTAVRQDRFWSTRLRSDTDAAPRSAVRAAYQAVAEAVKLLTYEAEELEAMRFSSSEQAFNGYRENWFRVDQGYRLFQECVSDAEAMGWDLLKALSERIEDFYGNSFLSRIGTGWGGLAESMLGDRWEVPGVPRQDRFFDTFVKPILEQGDDRRVFVIISDAFRFELGEELARTLNSQYRIEASLECQLGVLPSYTRLGMAALLPHEELRYDGAAVLADGSTTDGLSGRRKILEKAEGTAVKLEELRRMPKEEGRGFIRPYRVVYVYHDLIDATGDKASTESQTFRAARATIEELCALIRHLINNFNASNVFVTADHGFLFQRRPPDETDRASLKRATGKEAVAKKRYVIGRELGPRQGVLHGSVENTAGACGGMEFWLPRGNSRFHFVGGARFVHGGAMLQEIVVPVVRIRRAQGTRVEKTRIKRVGVSVLGNNFRITTNRHVFKLMQTEAVSDRVKPRSLKIGVYDEDEPVTNTDTVTFDCGSSDMNEWQRKVHLTLKSRDFSSTKRYHLILRDAETEVEVERYEVTIDLAFFNDF